MNANYSAMYIAFLYSRPEVPHYSYTVVIVIYMSNDQPEDRPHYTYSATYDIEIVRTTTAFKN